MRLPLPLSIRSEAALSSDTMISSRERPDLSLLAKFLCCHVKVSPLLVKKLNNILENVQILSNFCVIWHDLFSILTVLVFIGPVLMTTFSPDFLHFRTDTEGGQKKKRGETRSDFHLWVQLLQ